MVFEGIIDSVATLILLVGLPFLLVLFYLEGLILGKLLQPPAVFVTVVAVARPSAPWLIALCLGCTVAVVAGQWTAFRSFDPESPEVLGVRRRVPRIEHLPDLVLNRLGGRRVSMLNRLFDRYGGMAILVSTFLPVIRGLLAIPAGMSSYPTRRFLAMSLVGNVLYFPALVAVAFGILRILGLA